MNSSPKTGHPLARIDGMNSPSPIQSRRNGFTMLVVSYPGIVTSFWRMRMPCAMNATIRGTNHIGKRLSIWETLHQASYLTRLQALVARAECLDDGPFSNLTIHVSYNFTSLEFYADNRCVSRSFDNEFFLTGNQTSVDDCSAIEDGTIALDCYWANPHFAGHGGIGGTMANSAASIGDPLFFLHHAYVDRLWWEWQQVDPDTRTNAIGPLRNHPTEAYLTRESLPAPGSEFLDYSGDDGGNITTLSHVLWLTGLQPNVTIADVMDLSNNLNCAEYI